MTEPVADLKFTAKPSFKWGLLIFIIALGIRLLGIQWGLANSLHNQTYHPDEEVNWRYSQALNPAHLDFTPGFYGYGTLYFTALNVATDFSTTYFGGPQSKEDWQYVARCELAGRLLSASFGAGLAVCAFLIVFRLTNVLGGLASGLVVSFAPGLVVHSRFATVDMLAAFLLGLCALASFRLIEEREFTSKEIVKICIWSGVWAGFSAGTKYTGILGILAPIALLVLLHKKMAIKGGAIIVVAAVAAFVISTPGCLLDTQRFLADVAFEMQHTASGHGIVFDGTAPGYLYQIGNLCLGVGTITTFFGFGYLVFKSIKKAPWAIALLAFAIPTYLLIGKSQVKFYRYSIPLALPAALGIGMALGESDRTAWKGKVVVAVAAVAIVGLDGGGLRGTVTFTSAMLGPDPRDLAARDIKALSTPATTVGFVSDPWFWSPPLFPNTGLVRMIPFDQRNQFRLQASQPRVLQFVPEDSNQRLQWDPRLITQLNPDYITYSDFESLDFARLASEGPAFQTPEVKRYQDFMKLLQQKYTLKKVYGYDTDLVEDMRYVMTTVYLWQRKTTP